MPENLWGQVNGAPARGALNELVYRSNLLGTDRSVANWGGGNTSTKSVEIDFRGREIEVMWVKGSGSDLGTMEAKHFTSLKLEDITPLYERSEMTDEEMVEYLANCMVDAKRPRASIETLLHAFLPFKHVDHTHPDAIISLCCAHNGRQLAEEIYGDRFVWVPYIRPGFELSKMIADGVRNNPRAELVLMEKHGLVTWGDTSEACYHKTISIINEAEAYIRTRLDEERLFGGVKFESLPKERRNEIASSIMPVIRGAVSNGQRMLLAYDDSDAVMRFVNSTQAETLSQVGAACPDHLVHTKMVPLYLDWNPQTQDVADLIVTIKRGIDEYEQAYTAYFQANCGSGDVMFEPVPRVILIPGIGMINTGKNAAMANVSGALYHRAIEVMKGATTLGEFVSLNANESFNVEYWPLELYKLTLAPAEAEFSRQVAFVTGGAGGIGSAACQSLVAQGAHVVIADLNLEGAERVAREINEQHGEGRAIAVRMDVTKEAEVAAALKTAALAYGGVDIVVNNAGLATSSPFDETSLSEWNLNIGVLATGYFLVAREAFKLMKEQGIGGNMVFIGSKNSIYAGKNASAYSTAKAAEIHLARCIATEGGEFGIRVNSVLPDAVLQGSAIWNSDWRNERAAAYGIEPSELEEHYRKRTTLLVNVYPQDIVDAILFFASSKSAKTTGCMLTVDGGVAAAFTR